MKSCRLLNFHLITIKLQSKPEVIASHFTNLSFKNSIQNQKYRLNSRVTAFYHQQMFNSARHQSLIKVPSLHSKILCYIPVPKNRLYKVVMCIGFIQILIWLNRKAYIVLVFHHFLEKESFDER